MTLVELECFVMLAFHRNILGAGNCNSSSRDLFPPPLPKDVETAGGKVAAPLQGKNQVGLLA